MNEDATFVVGSQYNPEPPWTLKELTFNGLIIKRFMKKDNLNLGKFNTLC